MSLICIQVVFTPVLAVKSLFKETLRCYAEASLARLAACTEQASSPLDALRTFIKTGVVQNQQSSPSDICMLVKTVAELTQDHAELLAEAKRLLGEIENTFAALFTQAQEYGKLDKTKDPRRLARLLQMQLMGLSAYVRANDGDAPLSELIDDAFTCLR